MASSSNNAGGGRGGRKTRGRQKIEIKKMENESNLQVTFSKRRAGLFKKASELCTLCGVDVALIIFSPGDKVFSFGHPNLEAVLDRFLTGGGPPVRPSASVQMLEVHRSAALRGLNDQLTGLLEELEIEKKRGEELDKKLKNMEKASFLAQSVNSLKRDELWIYKDRLEDMRKALYQQADLAVHRFITNPSQFYVAGGGSSGGGGGGGGRMMMMMPPQPQPPLVQNLAAPAPAAPVIQDPMMLFEENMMLMSPPAAEAAAAPEGFQQYENMVVGENSGDGF